jgi:hypothetical protein
VEITGFKPRTAGLQSGVATNEPPLFPTNEPPLLPDKPSLFSDEPSLLSDEPSLLSDEPSLLPTTSKISSYHGGI